MATFTLEEIGQQVSELPALADPTLDAALAFLDALGGIENLQQDHLISADNQHPAPLADAIRNLLDLQDKCYTWGLGVCGLKPIINTHPPAEYGL